MIALRREGVEGQMQKEFDLFGISLDKLRATADANARELQQYHSLHQQRGTSLSGVGLAAAIALT
jgi:hypothetical protein